MISLIIATEADAASIGPCRKLLELGNWEAGQRVEGLDTWRCGSARIWQLKNKTIFEDLLDHRWQLGTGESVAEVIFMSRTVTFLVLAITWQASFVHLNGSARLSFVHVAASTRPALTVHPIGVPHLRPSETPPAGGKAGRVSPPCTRVGPWFRLLKRLAAEGGLVPEFEVTLEATHHGPYVDAPAMFVEIGSTEDHWGREDAAELIAQLFWQGLGLNGSPEVGKWTSQNAGEPVLLGLGGGHYTPRHADVGRHEGVWLGHLLSGYALPMTDPANGSPVLAKRGEPEVRSNGGSRLKTQQDGKSREQSPDSRTTEAKREDEAAPDMFEHAVREAYEATKRAFPGGRVLAHIDLKSMKAWQRERLCTYLEKEGIAVGQSKDF